MKKIFQYILMAVALVATASCSQELDDTLQPVENGTLQFVVSDFPAFDENPQTRASSLGTPDGGKTAWAEGDVITVTFISDYYGTQTATLTYNGSAWTSSSTLSYLKTETPTATAVYNPSTTSGLGEYLTTTDCTIADNTLSISFANAVRTYSRLRIVAEAEQELTVTVTDFTPADGGTASDSYSLTTDGNGNAYLYGTFAADGSVTVKNGETVLADKYTFTTATEAGKSYVLYAGKKTEVDLSEKTETYTITGDGYYLFTGTGNYGIKVESGNPRIVLNGASITVSSGSAIDIASGSNATIFVLGDNTLSTTAQYSNTTAGGIFVAEGGTVNITSNSTNNTLRVTGNSVAAIGGKYIYNSESYNAGNINISNVTVYAYTNNFYAAAIGAAGEGTCGTINITNAVVYAYGAGDQYTSAPGIGSAWSLVDWPDTIPIVIISDSEVHTFRYHSASDYIGYLGDVDGNVNGDTYATSSINCGEGGSVTSSTIYCYTGLDATTPDKVVEYDDDGNPTEN